MDEEVLQKIKEYMKTHGNLTGTTKSNKNHQEKHKKDKQSKPPESRLNNLLKNYPNKSIKQVDLQKELVDYNKKFNQIKNAGKQVFSVSISLLQLLNSLKQTSKNQSILEAIENYKGQLCKYHKIITNEGKPDNAQITEVVMMQHKNKLQKHYKDKNIDGIVQVLLSFRVNALQIAPQLRKNLAYQLIRNDVFKIQQLQGPQMIINLLQINQNMLRYSLTAFLSIISSTLRGVQYLIPSNNFQVIQKIIKITKEVQNGSVIQRFCLAFLQKCSVKDSVIPTIVQLDMIGWIINLIKKSISTKINQFCLDFASATLANIIHSDYTLQYLEHRSQYSFKVRQRQSDNVNFFKIDKRQYICKCINAYSNLLVIFVQVKIYQTYVKMQVC